MTASRLRDGFVRRPELVRRLTDARLATLAVIVAPAGYGKSTLLAEWAAEDDRPFVWISLEPRDDDATQLVDSIRLAIDEACRTQSEPRFVLVLDDAHVVAPAVLKTAVTTLLAGLEAGSQLVVASRTEPPLPLGRLRAHRRLVEVRQEDLAMAPAQAAALLELAGLELDVGAVGLLSSRTEGWPVGLYLAALSLRQQPDIGAVAGTFDGSDHLVADYFRDEFLDDLKPETRSFLMRSSVLDELSGPLCDEVLELRGSARLLAELDAANLMLVPLDRSRERYRWHELFAGMLRSELRRAEPELEPRLHSRASSCLRRRGDLDGAIAHAVAAGDVGRAGDLLWGNLVAYLAQGHQPLVQRWLRGFTETQVAGHPALALVAAHSCLFAGHLDQAQRWRLAAAEAELGWDDDATASWRAAATIIDAAQSGISAGEMAQAAGRAYDQEPDHGQWHPVCCLFMGVAERLLGHGDAARRYLEEGVRGCVATAPSIGALALAELGMMAIEDDDWEAGEELVERAGHLVATPALSEYPISALVFAVGAATRAHRGRVDEAKRDLRRAVNLLAALEDFIPWYGAQTRIMLARAALGLADTVRARTLLAEASRLARRTPDAVIFQASFDQAWAQIDTLAETALSGPSSLTIAELRILRFLPSHRSFREIAERLDVSVNTVKTQAHAIYRKLDAASRSEAVARASRAGLLGS